MSSVPVTKIWKVSHADVINQMIVLVFSSAFRNYYFSNSGTDVVGTYFYNWPESISSKVQMYYIEVNTTSVNDPYGMSMS